MAFDTISTELVAFVSGRFEHTLIFDCDKHTTDLQKHAFEVTRLRFETLNNVEVLNVVVLVLAAASHYLESRHELDPRGSIDTLHCGLPPGNVDKSPDGNPDFIDMVQNVTIARHVANANATTYSVIRHLI